MWNRPVAEVGVSAHQKSLGGIGLDNWIGGIVLRQFEHGERMGKIEQFTVFKSTRMILETFAGRGAGVIVGAGLDNFRAVRENFRLVPFGWTDDGDVSGFFVVGIFAGDDDELAFIGQLLRQQRRFHQLPALIRAIAAQPCLLRVRQQDGRMFWRM